MPFDSFSTANFLSCYHYFFSSSAHFSSLPQLSIERYPYFTEIHLTLCLFLRMSLVSSYRNLIGFAKNSFRLSSETYHVSACRILYKKATGCRKLVKTGKENKGLSKEVENENVTFLGRRRKNDFNLPFIQIIRHNSCEEFPLPFFILLPHNMETYLQRKGRG